MSEYTVTSYRGYTKVIGQISLPQFFNQFRGNLHRNSIEEIEKADAEGNILKAERIKKQLPYYTLTANYAECRLPCSLLRYNDLILLDFDKMLREKIPSLRHLCEEDPNTIGCALSPRRHGLKVLVYLRTEEADRLRRRLNEQGTVDYAELCRYHEAMYRLVAGYYAGLLDNEVDVSGSDLSRGMYATYDPEAFFSDDRLAQVEPLKIKLILPSKDEPVAKNKKKKHQDTLAVPEKTEGEAASIHIDPLSQLEYRKAVEYTKRKFRFEAGSRDSFIYCLGNQCYSRHITEEDALCMARRDYGNEPDFDMEVPLRNSYLYTRRTDAAEEEQKKPMITRVMEFLDKHYEIRRNTILDQLEFRPKTEESFSPLRGKDINSIYTRLHLSGIFSSVAMVKAVVDSSYAKDYNPFFAYFDSLQPWDGVTDYIGELAATVSAVDQDFWVESFRRWLVGMVACALDDDKQNQQLLLLYSQQGRGKSRFVHRLLPPSLGAYYRNGMINPDNKDHMLMLSTCLIVNFEEFDGVNANRLAELKRIITLEKVTERKVYDTQANTFVRHASFVASTNNPHCLQDIGENRRMLFNSLTHIDLSKPVNYEGVYSQALMLYRSGFRYWYEGGEIEELNRRNENFRLKDPVEENLFYYYRPATAQDCVVKWLPASAILGMLSVYGRTQSTRMSLQTLVTVLEANNFRQRESPQGITEYAVMEYTPEDRNRNAMQVKQQENESVLLSF